MDLISIFLRRTGRKTERRKEREKKKGCNQKRCRTGTRNPSSFPSQSIKMDQPLPAVPDNIKKTLTQLKKDLNCFNCVFKKYNLSILAANR